MLSCVGLDVWFSLKCAVEFVGCLSSSSPSVQIKSTRIPQRLGIVIATASTWHLLSRLSPRILSAGARGWDFGSVHPFVGDCEIVPPVAFLCLYFVVHRNDVGRGIPSLALFGGILGSRFPPLPGGVCPWEEAGGEQQEASVLNRLGTPAAADGREEFFFGEEKASGARFLERPLLALNRRRKPRRADSRVTRRELWVRGERTVGQEDARRNTRLVF